jgi:hypothetical protein
MRRFFARFALVLGVVMGMSFATAGAAMAATFEPPCKSQSNSYIVCFSIKQSGVSNFFDVHVGIDVYMSQQDAQNIIDAPGEPFVAKLMADDPFFDNFIEWIDVSWVATWERGLSAEFDGAARADQLDEDWDGHDEVFARVVLNIQSSDITRTFDSNVVQAPFHLYR